MKLRGHWYWIAVIPLLLLAGIQPVLAEAGVGGQAQNQDTWFTVKTKKPQPPTNTPEPKTATPIVTKTSIFRTASSPKTTLENTPTRKDTLAPTSDDRAEQTEAAYETQVQTTIEAMETGRAQYDEAVKKDPNAGCTKPAMVIPIGLTLVGLWKTRNKHTLL